jgi:NADH-quinone oxidoreductase subunit G/NADP-reducing hydrogenase subunit HndD
MFGAVAKTYYAQQAGIAPQDIVTVSVMPCTAKKMEAARPELGRGGRPDVDIVLTTRELIKLIKYVGLSFDKLPESGFDSPLGTSTGAAVIFGATGGVMEAALRTVAEKLTGKALGKLEFQEVQGMKGIRTCTLELAGRQIHTAIVHTLSQARLVMEQVQNGTSPYDFIEVMACPGGCVGGGGQPIGTTDAIRTKRAAALYAIDAAQPVRCSHENPDVQALYKDFLGAPLGPKAEALLHTTYHAVPQEYVFD